MPDDVEQLQRKIEECLRELKRLKAEEQRKPRPRLRLLKGGGLIAVGWAGVEWLIGDYKRVAVALAVSGLVATGGVIAEHPGSPSADPPPTTVKPAKPKPSPHPRAVATPTQTLNPTTPPRTSPLRTLGPRVIKPTATASRTPLPTPTVLVTATTTAITTTPLTVAPPVTVRPSINTTCPGVVRDLIEVKLCLPLGR